MKYAGSFGSAVNIPTRSWAFTSVKASFCDIQHIIARDLVVAARDHPELRGAIQWRVRTGALKAVLPGVYAPAATADSTATRITAVGRWDPDAVLTH